MRRLILMRHAKSSWAKPGQPDEDRPLNGRGKRSAALIGAWLAQLNYVPDVALVSPAARTRATFAGLSEAIGAVPSTLQPDLYHADPDTILAVVRGAPDVRTVLVLGHQPGIGAGADQLVREPQVNPDFARYPTAATAVIDFEVERWADVAWRTGHLTDFVCPRALD